MRKILLVVALLAGCSGGSGLAAADLPDVGERPHDSGAEAAAPDVGEPEEDASEPEDTGHRCDDVAYLPCDCGDGTQGRMPCSEDASQWPHCVCEPDAGEPDTSTTDSGMGAADSELDATQDSALDAGADAECVYQQVIVPKTIADAGATIARGGCAKLGGALVINDSAHKAICRTYCNYLGCSAWFLPYVFADDFVCEFNPDLGPTCKLEYYCLICK